MSITILEKIKHYCAYQERSHWQVRNKLLELGARHLQLEEIIVQLVEENYLNEVRFAQILAGSKFRQLQWGKNKIIVALKKHQLSAYCIKKGMQEISDDDYLKTLNDVALKKWQVLPKGGNKFSKMQKLSSYLLQKGFEQALVIKTVKTIVS